MGVQPATCAGQPVPAAVARLFAQAKARVAAAEGTTKPRKRTALLAKAMKALRKAGSLVSHAGKSKKHAVSSDCVAALLRVIGSAETGAQGCCGPT